MKTFVRKVRELIDRKETFALATVVKSSGSTPRSSGAKMVILEDGSIIGTVGGGLAEAMAAKTGQAMIKEGSHAAQLMFVDMTQELAADSDMICGGGLSMLIEPVRPESSCAAAYVEVDDRMRKGLRSAISTRCQGKDVLKVMGHEVITGNVSELILLEEDANGLHLVEPFIPSAPLFIFGAGHVSLFTASVGAMVGFRTVVLDDRADFANQQRFPEADEIIVLNAFDACCDGLNIGEDAFIVIVTRGHLHDKTVLAEALNTKAGYIGMIGSKTKRDKIYETLLEEGFTQADLDRCHCPIGLKIGGRTPEEIAVSITAELIQVRAGSAK